MAVTEKRIMQFLLLVSAIIQLSIHCFSLTMATPEQFEQFFRDADTDEDGYLTLEELIAVLKKNDYTGSDEQILVN